jgi:hypothetical protein
MRCLLRLAPLALLIAAGCATPLPPPAGGRAVDARTLEIEARQDDVLRQLAACESGGNGDSDRPIVGGRGAYYGRFQFSPRTVIGFVRDMDGRRLSVNEAIALAHDYRQATALARYVIFERDGISHWPACNRKLGLASQVSAIKSL